MRHEAKEMTFLLMYHASCLMLRMSHAENYMEETYEHRENFNDNQNKKSLVLIIPKMERRLEEYDTHRAY